MSNQPIEKRSNLIIKVVDWMDERFQVRALVDSALHVFVPKESKTFYLGGITLFLFAIQGVTGSLLALYYQPTPETAYDSVLFITGSVNFGWLIRSIHSWGANLMIVFCVLHLLRIFFQGVYKRPREVTWGVGVVLLAATMGFGFTGYLLPWDQRAFWATTVGSEIAGSIPVVGEYLLNFMRGGADVTAATLSRFFGVHTLVLPVTLIGFVGVHLLLIHQQGLANPKKPQAEPTEEDKKKAVKFFPNYIVKEGIAWYTILAVLVILASLFPVGLEGKANPIETPAHIKPEWYFLSLYQLLKFVPRTVGVLAPIVAVAFIFFIPFLDRREDEGTKARLIRIVAGVVTIIALIVLTIWGWTS